MLASCLFSVLWFACSHLCTFKRRSMTSRPSDPSRVRRTIVQVLLFALVHPTTLAFNSSSLTISTAVSLSVACNPEKLVRDVVYLQTLSICTADPELCCFRNLTFCAKGYGCCYLFIGECSYSSVKLESSVRTNASATGILEEKEQCQCATTTGAQDQLTLPAKALEAAKCPAAQRARPLLATKPTLKPEALLRPQVATPARQCDSSSASGAWTSMVRACTLGERLCCSLRRMLGEEGACVYEWFACEPDSVRLRPLKCVDGINDVVQVADVDSGECACDQTLAACEPLSWVPLKFLRRDPACLPMVRDPAGGVGSCATASTQPPPKASSQPPPKASSQPSPEASSQPSPEASSQPPPEASSQPSPEASSQPSPEASLQPLAKGSSQPPPAFDRRWLGLIIPVIVVFLVIIAIFVMRHLGVIPKRCGRLSNCLPAFLRRLGPSPSTSERLGSSPSITNTISKTRYDVFLSYRAGEGLLFEEQDAKNIEDFLSNYVVNDINKEWNNEMPRTKLSVFLEGQDIQQHRNEVTQALQQTRGGGLFVCMITKDYFSNGGGVLAEAIRLSGLPGGNGNEQVQLYILCLDLVAKHVEERISRTTGVSGVRVWELATNQSRGAGRIGSEIARAVVKRLTESKCVPGRSIKESFANLESGALNRPLTGLLPLGGAWVKLTSQNSRFRHQEHT